jgi:hypothetical protein
MLEGTEEDPCGEVTNLSLVCINVNALIEYVESDSTQARVGPVLVPKERGKKDKHPGKYEKSSRERSSEHKLKGRNLKTSGTGESQYSSKKADVERFRGKVTSEVDNIEPQTPEFLSFDTSENALVGFQEKPLPHFSERKNNGDLDAYDFFKPQMYRFVVFQMIFETYLTKRLCLFYYRFYHGDVVLPFKLPGKARGSNYAGLEGRSFRVLL